MVKRAFYLLFVSILLLTGCGKNIPEIDPALLQKKHSLLVITKQGLPPESAAIIQKNLTQWRNTQHIAFEWMQSVGAIDQQAISNILSAPYDYVIVIGSDLARQAAGAAVNLAEQKWILLDDSVTVPMALDSSQIMWKQTGPGFMETQWQEWVKQQQVIGKTIEWVTQSNNPIPSLWAPSEEAEHISLSDAEGWYSEFQARVRQQRPDWIVVYSPLQDSLLQRMKSLHVPIMNMASTTVNLQWEIIFSRLLGYIQGGWTPGVTQYNLEEITVSKPE
ncbi:hypothetical protein [Paenibacillus xerothermodurans]|uniref:ABC transporter substrate-binding protein n=1 Tax=Paenibacillus xerothermodurans TaxID=1977292 RepID=A0A2W1P5J0_PAEXE|nr:hypothetical protein [Paenibacillus xerothermodurans]PZE22388.1 hypothetical protein CBW46_000985 [Paenibacillus xerothermodurans]